MASQALSIPEIHSVVSSNGVEMEGGKASCVELLRGDPYLIKWQAEVFGSIKMAKCFPLFSKCLRCACKPPACTCKCVCVRVCVSVCIVDTLYLDVRLRLNIPDSVFWCSHGNTSNFSPHSSFNISVVLYSMKHQLKIPDLSEQQNFVKPFNGKLAKTCNIMFLHYR